MTTLPMPNLDDWFDEMLARHRNRTRNVANAEQFENAAAALVDDRPEMADSTFALARLMRDRACFWSIEGNSSSLGPHMGQAVFLIMLATRLYDAGLRQGAHPAPEAVL